MSAAHALTLHEWAQPVRVYGQSLLGEVQDAHALLDHQPAPQPGLIRTVMDAADRFDRLGGAQQQRVRQLILRHRAHTARW